MYTFDYYFYPDKSKCDLLNYYDEYLSFFLSSLTRNGQIIDQRWNIVEDGEAIKFICMAIDEDSLDPKYYNCYCKESLSKLNGVSIRSPKYVLAGETIGASGCCSCTQSSFYILYTTFTADYPPIRGQLPAIQKLLDKFLSIILKEKSGGNHLSGED